MLSLVEFWMSGLMLVWSDVGLDDWMIGWKIWI